VGGYSKFQDMSIVKMQYVITDAIKSVQTNKEKLTTMSNMNEDNESQKPDYDEDKDQLEERQEEETGERETTNQVF
jgi:hypothetical protein